MRVNCISYSICPRTGYTSLHIIHTGFEVRFVECCKTRKVHDLCLGLCVPIPKRVSGRRGIKCDAYIKDADHCEKGKVMSDIYCCTVLNFTTC